MTLSKTTTMAAGTLFCLSIAGSAWAQEGAVEQAQDTLGADAMMNEGQEPENPPASMDMISIAGASFDDDTVTFPTVMTTGNGYIVIHAIENGEIVAPQSLASTAVPAGENTDVEVTVPGGLVPGQSYAAMLHAETNGNDSYDYGMGTTDVDVPVTANGAPVTERFTVGPES